MELPADQRAQTAPRQGRVAQVGVHLVPGVAHRGVHVAHMALIRAGEHALGHQMAAAHHQGVVGQVELLDRQGQQRQVLLHMTHPSRQLLDEAGADAAPLQPAAGMAAFAIHQGKQLGLTEQGIQLTHHQLGASHGPRREPLVHEGNRAGEGRHGDQRRRRVLKKACS